MEPFITMSILIVSILMTVATIGIAIYLVHYFFVQSKSESVDIASFLKYTASIIVIFNALNAFFNSIYCMYFIWDPEYDDTIFYVHHEGHIQRILSTICWYIAKVALIYVFTFRLYWSFKGSMHQINKTFIISINVFNTIIALIGLISAYYAVYHDNLILAEISFNLWRILYQIIISLVLFMFTKRLLLLSMLSQSNKNPVQLSKIQNVESYPKKTTVSELTTPESGHNSKPKLRNDISLSLSLREDDVTNGQNQQHLEDTNSKTVMKSIASQSMDEQKHKEHVQETDKQETDKTDFYFLAITTRNAILMLSISFTVFLVTFCFFGFRFIFGEQTRITLLIPMNMAVLDSLNTSICIVSLFKCGERLYFILCGQCDTKCKRICNQIAKTTLA